MIDENFHYFFRPFFSAKLYVLQYNMHYAQQGVDSIGCSELLVAGGDV